MKDGETAASGGDQVAESGEGPPGGLQIERRGALAAVRLARPEALNAISGAMRNAMQEAFARFGRDAGLYAVLLRSDVPGVFSVGGDVAEIAAAATTDPVAARRALAEEYGLCWIAECLSKPAVSLLDGQVMGTGVGISLYNTHRVAGEAYRFSMPEVRIGYFPDCGVSRALALMPDGIGLYLGLTGQSLRRADALALGLVTHCIPSARFAEIEAGLADADPVDPLLDDRHVDPGAAPLLAKAATIRRYFDRASLQEIRARLAAPEAGDEAFAEETRRMLALASPTALAVTDRMIRRARHLDLRETLLLDYRVGCRMILAPDFREGVRARLVEKDGMPRWQPGEGTDVTPSELDALFAPDAGPPLVLPERAAMQAARV